MLAAPAAVVASDSSAPPVVHPEPDEVDTDGLSRSIVRRVIARHGSAVRACYEHARTDHVGALEGVVVVHFVIAGDGHVTSSTVAESTVADPGVGSCIAAAIAHMTFPMTRTGRPVVITYPFRLTR